MMRTSIWGKREENNMLRIILTLTILLFILIFTAVPICWALGIVGVVGLLLIGGNALTLVPQSLYAGINYFPFLAVPFFILAGELMNKGGITKKLINLSRLIIGRVPGSLAYVNILTSMFFGGITGSAQADTSCVGGILIPAMQEEGYDDTTAVAVTASSSVIGPIIPPSIIMVIYGSTMNVSIGAMFMGGLVPGILVGFALMAVVAIQNKTKHFPVTDKVYTKEEVKSILLDSLIPLGMPFIIMGGILGGVFTATEAGAVACVYALVVSVFLMKTVKLSDLPPMLRRTALNTASILIIIGCSKIISWVFALLNIQQAIGNFMASYVGNAFSFLLLVNILLLFMGTFLDGSAALIMMAPILAPIAIQYGISPLQFGLIMCINLTIGHATPPLGLCLFIGCKLGRISLARGGIAILPYVLAEILVLLLLTYFPAISLTLPRIMGFAV